MEPRPKEIQALNEAEILLKYSLSNRDGLGVDTILAIENAWQAEAQKSWSPTIAQEFLIAFNKLCLLVAPVTADTIAAGEPVISPPAWRKRFFGAKTSTSIAARFVQRCLILLLVLLFFAAVLGFGVTTANNLSNGINEMLKTSDGNIVPIATETDKIFAKIGDGKFNAAVTDDETRKTITHVQGEIHDINSVEANVLQKAYILSQIAFLGFEPAGYSVGVGTVNSVPEARDDIRAYYEVRDSVRDTAQKAGIIIGIVNDSLLPIVLGAMGACAYVVRMISDQIKSNTFYRHSPIRHVTRIALGGLAGIVIGYGMISTGGVAISAAALAFIAGYAIEPVFATLDKIANTFK